MPKQRTIPFLLAILAAYIIAAWLQGCISTRCNAISAFGNLGNQVNSPFDEYAPVLTDTSTLMFTSSRILKGRGGLQEQYKSVRPVHLFFTMRLSGDWDEAQTYTLMFGETEPEAATLSFAKTPSPLNATAYISACNRNGGVGGCDIYAITNGDTPAILNLGPEINSPEWDGQPYVMPDGTRLYFASDRPGGLGGSDIWICDRQQSGFWGTPYNAGAAVNTAGDEYSPYFDEATDNFYFAGSTISTGLDIFVLNAGSSDRATLPAPYNSPQDDYTPHIINGTFYLSSNRTGGCGGFDLYSFPLAGY